MKKQKTEKAFIGKQKPKKTINNSDSTKNIKKRKVNNMQCQLNKYNEFVLSYGRARQMLF